ncbi:MAG: hypothetical protein QOH15_431 [Gaiellales bacterium]|jgi:hypothetical protein|nr:hypothetical protein [Gaiellales bacterium]
MRLRVPPLLVALPLLGIARLLPEHGFGLWLRLAAATLVLLLPGRLVARAVGRGGPAAAFVWSVGLVAAALALTFAVHGSLTLTLVLVLSAGALALPFQKRQVRDGYKRVPAAVALAGMGLGIALWSIEGIVKGDALFHLGRMRKLEDFGALSLRAVDEFKDGGLHPGYAFPLWHGWLALVAKLAAVDPSSVVLHESSILAPLALVLAYEMGRQVFRSTWLALGTMFAQVAMIALAPGGGGAYTSLELPGTTARQLLVPAVIALYFRFVRDPSWPVAITLAVAGMDLAFVHPTYALFIAIPLVGYALVRVLATSEDLRSSVSGLLAFGLPVLAVFAWLAPIVAETRSHTPTATDKAAAFAQYFTDLSVGSPSSYHLLPGLVGRTGAVAVAALVLTPLAALAARRRWSALVLGGMVLVLALELSSFLFPRFSDLVSLSQSRRAAGFVPFAFAVAGGAAVLTRAFSVLVLPMALAAGIVLQQLYPGDFEQHYVHGGPAVVTWIALWGGVAGIAAAIVLDRRGLGRYERPGMLAGLAVALFVLPVAVHGFAHWDKGPAQDANALTPGLVQFLRVDVPERSVVYADLETSYRISAYAPVYVANAPPTHVADTKANDPAGRRAAWLDYRRTHNLAIPRHYGAGWLVLRGDEQVGHGARLVYRDGLFRVYRL